MPFADSATGGYWRSMYVKNDTATLQQPVDSTNGTKIPNVVGLGLKDAVYMTENNGLKVTITGRGRVISQSLPAGTTFKKGQAIILFLN